MTTEPEPAPKTPDPPYPPAPVPVPPLPYAPEPVRDPQEQPGTREVPLTGDPQADGEPA
jgi:hypothetical protein